MDPNVSGAIITENTANIEILVCIADGAEINQTFRPGVFVATPNVKSNFVQVALAGAVDGRLYPPFLISSTDRTWLAQYYRSFDLNALPRNVQRDDPDMYRIRELYALVLNAIALDMTEQGFVDRVNVFIYYMSAAAPLASKPILLQQPAVWNYQSARLLLLQAFVFAFRNDATHLAALQEFFDTEYPQLAVDLQLAETRRAI